MAYTAYLFVLEHEGVPVDMEQIHEELLQMRFNAVRPFEEYTPDTPGRFVVWRYSSDDKLTDEAAQELVGKDGNVCYIWLCPRCKRRVSKTEYPFDHKKDVQFSCSCPGTAWGCVIC